MKTTLIILLLTTGVVIADNARRAQSSLWQGLVAHWCLNEGTTNVLDSAIGSTRTGRLTTNTWGTGYIGRAVQFPSPPNTGFNILCTTSPISAYPFTLAVRFKTSYAYNGISGYMMAYGNTADNNSYFALLLNQSGKMQMGLRSGITNDINYTTNTTSLTNGVWHTGVGVFHQTNHFALYVDGSFAASNSVVFEQTAKLPTVDNLTIGCWRRTGLLTPFSGLIDECNAWNRALTPIEISQLHKSFQ